MTEGTRRSFIQPEGVNVPAKNDPLRWATMLTTRTNWLRATAQQLSERGVDAGKLVLGSVLDSIIFDDTNQYHLIHASVEDPGLASINSPGKVANSQANALERLRWESQTLQSPQMAVIAGRLQIPQRTLEVINERLGKAQGIIATANWQDSGDFQRVKNAREALVGNVKDMVADDPHLNEALAYPHDEVASRIWMPLFAEYVMSKEEVNE
jgi:hypothetical protein